MASELAVETTGLTKRFKEVVALDGFDLAVAHGSVHGLLGPNGAGKTTAVRVLATLLDADSGTARVAGVDVVTGPAGGTPEDRVGRPVRRRRRDPHRTPEPVPVRPALPPQPASGRRARGGAAGSSST